MDLTTNYVLALIFREGRPRTRSSSRRLCVAITTLSRRPALRAYSTDFGVFTPAIRHVVTLNNIKLFAEIWLEIETIDSVLNYSARLLELTTMTSTTLSSSTTCIAPAIRTVVELELAKQRSSTTSTAFTIRTADGIKLVKQHVDEVMIGTKWLTECVGKSSCHDDSCAAHRRDYCVQSSRLELCQHGFQNRSSCQIRVVVDSRCLESGDAVTSRV